MEGGGEFLALPCGQHTQVTESQQQALFGLCGSVVFLDSTNTARNRRDSWKFNRGVAATEGRTGRWRGEEVRRKSAESVQENRGASAACVAACLCRSLPPLLNTEPCRGCLCCE